MTEPPMKPLLKVDIFNCNWLEWSVYFPSLLLSLAKRVPFQIGRQLVWRMPSLLPHASLPKLALKLSARRPFFFRQETSWRRKVHINLIILSIHWFIIFWCPPILNLNIELILVAINVAIFYTFMASVTLNKATLLNFLQKHEESFKWDGVHWRRSMYGTRQGSFF